ncbi:MAG: sodium:solute symporter family transporter, partial [Eubacteriales bacterium]
SASMSTLSSLVLTSSATLTLDVVEECFAKKMSDKKQVFVMRGFVVVFIAISAIIAIVQYKGDITFIAQLMGISWGALAGAFLAPFIFGLYVKRTSKAAVWTSFIFGTGIMVLNMAAKQLFPVWLQSPINCGAFAMIAGLVIVPAVSVFTKSPNNQLVEDSFACYNRKVTTIAKDSLGEND